MIKLTRILNEYISASQLNQVEKYLDKVWAKVGIDVEFTKHFLDRVNDARNGKPINTAEVIKIFRLVYKKYGKQISSLPDGINLLFKDMRSDINVPVVLRYDKLNKEIDMISKTVMRKKNFKSSTKKYAVESATNNYGADDGEPDTGFLAGDKVRTLGTLKGKPEMWFNRGDYKQMAFPKADYIYGKGEKEDFAVIKKAYIEDVEAQLDAEDTSWEKYVKESYKPPKSIDGKKLDKMIKSKDFTIIGHWRKGKKKTSHLHVRHNPSGKRFDVKVNEQQINERVDYLHIATEIVKAYGLKSKVRFSKGKDFGDYIPETDTIKIRSSYPNMKEFIITVLHEIKHALDAKQIGVRKFIKKYAQAGTMAQYKGLDPHDDNKWEERAERWAISQYKKIKNKLNF